MVLGALAVAELFLFLDAQALGLLAHLLVDVLLALVVLVLAAGFQVQLVDAPVVEVVAEGNDAHLFDQVQFARPVKVQDRAEGARMSVEEVLVVHQRVVVAQFDDGLVGGAVTQPTQSGVRKPFQRPPENFVPDAAHVDADASIQRFAPHDHERLRRKRSHGARMRPVDGSQSGRRTTGRHQTDGSGHPQLGGHPFVVVVAVVLRVASAAGRHIQLHRRADGRPVDQAAAWCRVARTFRAGRWIVVIAP